MAASGAQGLGDDGLFRAASRIVDQARTAVASHASSVQVVAYWQLGRLIDAEILRRGRADYGKQILATLSQELAEHYGRGFVEASLGKEWMGTERVSGWS